MNIKLLTKQHLEFLRLKGGCTGSSECTLVKVLHCRKSRVAAHIGSMAFGDWFVPVYLRKISIQLQTSWALKRNAIWFKHILLAIKVDVFNDGPTLNEGWVAL